MKQFNLAGPCLVALGLVFCASITGCSKDEVASPVTTDSTVAPKQGATYTYFYQRLNQDSAAAGSPSTLLQTVLGTSTSIDGKQNVHAMQSGMGTKYYYFEANGDVSVDADANILQPAFVNAPTYNLTKAWYTLPIAVKTVRNDTLIKTQNWNNGTIGGLPLLIHATSEQTGSADVTLGSETFKAVSGTTVLVVQEASSLYRVRIQWTFVPKLGFFSELDEYVPPGFFSGAVNAGGYVLKLTAYTK